MRRDRRAVWVAAACLVATLGTPAMPRVAEPPAASPRPYLWRVERYGRTSHLFGTIHVGLDADAALGPAGCQALDGARRVFVEMDMTSLETVDEFTMGAIRRAEMPPDQSLRVLLRADAWRHLAALHAGRLTPAELERLEPWFVSQWTLPRMLTPRKTALPGVRRDAPPLDAAISLRADAQGTRVTPLESPAGISGP